MLPFRCSFVFLLSLLFVGTKNGEETEYSGEAGIQKMHSR